MANTTDKTAANTEVAKTEPMPFRPDTLREVTNFDDALALAQETWGGVASASDEIGDGFVMLDDTVGGKDKLINVPFIALGWVFTLGDFGADYLIMRVVTKEGGKFIVTDGGTGLCQQVKSYQERTGKNGGLYVERGLRKSEYDNEFGHGVTHYLNV